jgi:hypothetical protein
MDGGQSWNTVYNITDQNNFAFNPDNLHQNEALLCTDQGLYRSTNILSGSVNFGSINNTLSLRQNYRVASNPFDVQNVVMAAEDAGLFNTLNNGLSWDEKSPGGDGTNMVRSEGPTNSFMGNKGLDNHIFYSQDFGKT